MKKNFIKNIIITTLLYEGLSAVISNCSNKLIKKNNRKFQVFEKDIALKGYFVLTKYGVSREFTKAKNRKIVWYSDAFCPDCRNAYKALEDIIDSIKAGEVELEFHPLNYMDRRSINNYSLKTSTAILGIAVISPSNIFEALKIIYENSLFENDYNKDIYYFLKKALLSEEDINRFKKNLRLFEYGVLKGTNNFFHNNELNSIVKEENRDLFIPFIYDNLSKELFDGENIDYKKEIVDKIINNKINS